MTCEININKKPVPFNDVVQALREVPKHPTVELGITKGFDKITNDNISLNDWTEWFYGVQKNPDKIDIRGEDIGTSDNAARLTSLLNLETIGDRATPELRAAFNALKKKILAQSEALTTAQVNALLEQADAAIAVALKEDNAGRLKTSAKSGLKSKVPSGLFPTYQKLLTLTLRQVPVDMRGDYMKILAALGKRKSELDLNEIYELQGLAKDIIAAAAEPEPTHVPEDSQIEKEIRKKFILGQEVDSSKVENTHEKKLVDELLSIISETTLDNLTNKELQLLMDVMKNIKDNGGVSRNVFTLVKKMSSESGSNILAPILKAVSGINITNWMQTLFAKIKTKAKGGDKSGFYQRIRARSSFAIDEIIGNRGTELHDLMWRPISVAENLYETLKSEIQGKSSLLRDKLIEKYRGNKATKIIYTTKAIELAIKANTNPGQFTFQQYINTIKKAVNARTTNNYDESDVKMLEEIAAEFVKDGVFDIDAATQSLPKEGKDILDHNKQVYQEMGPLASFVSGVIRGDRIESIEGNTHESLLDREGSEKDYKIALNRMDPSITDKSTEAEQDSKEAPLISFDSLNDSTKYAGLTLLDFHVTPEILKTTELLKKLQDKVTADDASSNAAKDVAQALKDHFKYQISLELSRSVTVDNGVIHSLKGLSRIAYAAELSSVPRFFGELMGVSFALITKPVSYAKGLVSKATRNSSLAIQVLKEYGSLQTTRMYASGETSSRFVDQTYTDANRAKKFKARSKTQNRITTVTDFITKNPIVRGGKFVIRGVVKALMTGADLIVMRPLYWGSFEKKFQELSGEAFDYNNFKDPGYKAKNNKAIKEALKLADRRGAAAGTSSSKFAGIAKLKRDPNEHPLEQAYKWISGHLMSYMVWEGDTFRRGVAGAAGKNELTRGEGLALIAGSTVRGGTYMTGIKVATHYFSKFISYLRGDDEEEEELDWEALGREQIRDFLGAMLTLQFQGTLTSTPRVPINIGIEYFNENHLEVLRDEEVYSQWEHNMAFSIVSERDFRYDASVYDFIGKNFSGQLRRPFKEASSLFEDYKILRNPKSSFEKKQFVRGIMQERALLTLSGYTGLNPIYRDMRIQAEKDFRKAKDAFKLYNRRSKKSSTPATR